jgi:hypothetical protein
MRACIELVKQITFYPISCETSAGGYFVWAKVNNLAKQACEVHPATQNFKPNIPFETLDIFSTNFVI